MCREEIPSLSRMNIIRIKNIKNSLKKYSPEIITQLIMMKAK